MGAKTEKEFLSIQQADTRLHMGAFSHERKVGPDLGPNFLQRFSAVNIGTDVCGLKWPP